MKRHVGRGPGAVMEEHMALSTGRSGQNSIYLVQETHCAGLWKALNVRSPHISGGIPEMVK